MKGVKNMKKQYVKPELYFENFELSTSIAACANPTHTPSGGTCSVDAGNGLKAFTSDMGECNYHPQDGDSGCYHQPTEATKLFNS